MAAAKYFFQNNNYRQVLNLLCYTTEYPHMLTSTQKITRLYRYIPPHSAASSAERRNGPSAKTDATQTTTTATSSKTEEPSKPSSMCPKIQPSSDKHSKHSRKE